MNQRLEEAALFQGATVLPVVILAVLGLAPQATADPQDEAPEHVARARFLMGSSLSIEVEGRVSADVLEEAFAEVARLEDVLSNWRPTSELSRVNQRAAREAVRCSSDLFEALSIALRWAEATGGDFDPTVEPLVVALGLRNPVDRLPDGTLPGDTRGEPAATGPVSHGPVGALPVGWRRVHLERSSRSVRFEAPGMGIDLGGIGKGIALDAAARVLRRRGVDRALLDFGGQVLAIGRPSRTAGWEVGIADPEDRGSAVALVHIADLSIATSSNGERRMSSPPGLVGHILDPAKQRAARFDGSVSVCASDATAADALTKPLFVKGPEQGIRWADERQIPALYLWRDADGRLQRKPTRAFERVFKEPADAPGR